MILIGHTRLNSGRKAFCAKANKNNIKELINYMTNTRRIVWAPGSDIN